MKYLCLLALFWTAACNFKANTASYLAEGNALSAENRHADAFSLYRKAIEADPLSGEAYYRAGLSAMKLSKWPDAVRYLERAIGLMPENLDAHSSLANVYLFAYGANEHARKGLFGPMKSLSATMHERFPNSFDDARLQGFVALFSNDPAGAVKHFAVANEIRPYEPHLTFFYMHALRSSGQAAQAEQLTEAALKQHPDALALYDALFQSYRQTNRAADAERILRLKIANNPKVAEGHLELAALLFKSARYPQMAGVLEQISSNTADFPAGALQAGDFYLRIGMLDPAMEHYRRCIATGGNWKRLCQIRTVNVLLKQNKLAEAEQIVAALRAETPSDPQVVALDGSLAVAGKRPADAISLFESALPQLPDDFVLRYLYARALLLSGKFPAAITQCVESLKLRHDYLWPRVVLAHLAVEGRRLGSAITLMSEIEADPGINVPFDTAGQGPQERPSYEAILAIKAPSAGALKDLNAILTAKRREMDQELNMSQKAKHQPVEP